MWHEVNASCETPSGFAVDQVRGMFDLPVAAKAKVSYRVETPEPEELIDGQPWRVGVIVGPSGSGKSTVARDVYGKAFVSGFDWPGGKAVVDCFDGVPMKSLTKTLTSVGFSSPPAWIKPHQVLSGGEKFRCDLARALLMGGDLVAFDEFTSVVDRTVAKVGSAAIAKAVRKNAFGPAKQFVAVTCHYDVIEWLEPDWVLDMSTQELARGRLWRRPSFTLTFAPIDRTAWRVFRHHHYLNTALSRTSTTFAAFWNETPVAFTAWTHRMVKQRREHDMREHRTVVLPDFQGIGIGNRVSEIGASYWLGLGGRAFSTTSHPGMIHYRAASPLWRTIRFGHCSPMGATGRYARELSAGLRSKPSSSCSRVTAGFHYVGPPMAAELAERLSRARPALFAPEGAMRALLCLLAAQDLATVKSLARRLSVSASCVQTLLGDLLDRGEAEKHPIAKGRFAWRLSPNARLAFGSLRS